MKSKPSRSAGVVPVLVLISLAPALPAWGQVRDLRCTRVAAGEAPRIDGKLSDAAWQKATWYDDFRQSVPEYGRSATEATHVAFIYDDHNLYVGVRCDDDAPSLIRANKLRHRDEPTTDDHVEVVFDTYRDQVRGTVFIVNPLGAKEEGLINGYENYTWSWDEVWEARAAITATGWQAELRIPFRVLRYGSDPQQTWVVNVERVVRRTQEESYLVPPRPPFDISSLDYAATLSGMEITTHQRNLQLIPYVLGGVARESTPDGGRERSRSLDQWGFDVKYSLTPGLTLDGTYNTDFAQVEADAEQVNLSRFSLFYPEKREFFLENAQLFSFGHFGGDPEQPDIAAFFSRRVGLYGGATVPIDAGVRLTGKVGRQDVGVLSVRTGGVPGLGLPAAWYNVARVRRDLGERSYVGMIATDSRRGGFHSTTLGVDGDWFITRELSLRGDYLRVDDSDMGGVRSAYDVSLDLTTDRWGFLFGGYQVDAGFNPDLGFVSRDGYRRSQAYLRRSFRPGRWGIRRVSVISSNDAYDSLRHGVRETGDNSLSCELELESGDVVEVRVKREFERLFEPFELDPHLVLPAGAYTFTGTSASYYSDESRRWGFDVEATGGDFYDGTTRQLGGETWFVFNRHLRTAGGYSTVNVSSPHGDLKWRLWSARLDYIHSATLSASGYLQYNSSIGARVLNLRLRWILRNDSDLYLVYNEGRQELAGAPDLRNRELALKVNYRLFI
ncbi:MAG TPA: DUF5916 domain-containing protein [Thermoanaerobaculaceae bacterium]|nr:DUF5916 domain-containing protein [Thermoanaerobaculaceae bacterium]